MSLVQLGEWTQGGHRVDTGGPAGGSRGSWAGLGCPWGQQGTRGAGWFCVSAPRFDSPASTQASPRASPEAPRKPGKGHKEAPSTERANGAGEGPVGDLEQRSGVAGSCELRGERVGGACQADIGLSAGVRDGVEGQFIESHGPQGSACGDQQESSHDQQPQRVRARATPARAAITQLWASAVEREQARLRHPPASLTSW